MSDVECKIADPILAGFEQRLGRELPNVTSVMPCVFDPIWAQKAHRDSERCEMLHVLRGQITLHVAGKNWVAGPGDTLLIPANSLHRDEFDPEQGLEVLMVFFTWAAQDDYFSLVTNETLINLPPPRKDELGRLFERMRTDIAGDFPADRLVTQARVLSVLMVMLREAVQGVGSVAHSAGSDGDYGKRRRHRLMQDAKHYVEEHYSECIVLDDIAAALNVSPFHLSHVFSRESDFSVFSYLTAVRMKQARTMLSKDKATVAEVAYAVGYEDSSYFSKVFKKHYGCPPRDFLVQS